jgi:mannose-6-phosphate isomerase-like protein (cupin superfamily)
MDLFLKNWNSGNFTETERADIIQGFTSLKLAISTNDSSHLIQLKPVLSQLFLFASQSEFNKNECLELINSFIVENSNVVCSETISHFLEHIWKDIQFSRLSFIIDKINSKQSLTHSNNVEDFHSSLNDNRLTSLYSNKSDKLNIDFEVQLLPFPLEILDPRIVKIPAGKSNELHKHAHETVFVFIKGSGHVKIDDLKIPVKSGDFVFIPRWCMHQSVNESIEEMVFLAVADFGLTGKSFVGNYLKTARLKLPE